MRVSIVIPVYNEKDTILPLVDRVLDLALDKDVVIVDDGSTDGSAELLKASVEGRRAVRVLYHAQNRGKGAALRTGFRAATGDVVVVQDADLELDPRDLVKVTAPVREGRAEVTYGSRFAGKNTRAVNLAYLANRFLTTLTNVLYSASITDMETCYKCFRADVLRRFTIESDRFDFEPEITAKVLRLGYRIHEVPISYTPRSRREGKKIGWRDGLKAVRVLVRYRTRALEELAGPG